MGKAQRSNPFQRMNGNVTDEVLDQLGRALGPGDLVLFTNSPAVFYRVLHIDTPQNVDPRAQLPPKARVLTLVAEWQDIVPGGQPLSGLLKIDNAPEPAAPPTPDIVLAES